MNTTKFRHLVSKVTIEGNAPDSIVQEILQWMKEAKPEVIYKQTWPFSYKGGK